VGDVLGEKELYDWVHRNDRVHLVSGRRTHGLSALSRSPKFVSINSTLEIDLYGQINSEVLGSGQAGGIGGSLDFMMGAQFDNNRSIVTLPSTTSSGISRIVAGMHGAIVTVPRSLVQFVVTEYGAVDLRDMNQRDRAAALVSIAHPDHRPALVRAAAKLG
jgi:acyl-CoA hydrolase